MAVNTAPMREERAKLIADSRAIVDKADTEKRTMSAEERKSYDDLWGKAEAKRTEYEDAERRNELERAEAELRHG